MRFKTKSGDVIRTMRFVAASPRAPVMPVPSMFNPLIWGDEEQRYGEIAGTRKWTRLQPPQQLGFGAKPHGTPEQLAAVSPCSIIPRVASGDFLRLPECAAAAALFRGLPLNPSDRANNALLLSLIWSVYNETDSQTQARVQAFFGPTATVQVLSRVSPLAPKAILVHTPMGFLFVSEGTTNEQQLIGQVVSSLSGPVTRNGIDGAELPLVIAADYYGQIRSIIAASDEPIIFAGHSYGGALAQMVAAMFARNGAPNHVAVTTFGAPRHIGLESQRIIESIPHTTVVEKEDVVPHLPPHAASLSWFIPLKGEVIARRFNLYVNVPPVYVVGGGPPFIDPAYIDPNTDDLEDVFLYIISHGQLPPVIESHSTATYVNDYAFDGAEALIPSWMDATQETAYRELLFSIVGH